MREPLSAADVRVLGSLIEKEQTTPDSYPLSLNALVNACNQSSNRDPVVHFDEATVSQSIDALRQRGLVRATRGIDARVTKYAHRAADVLSLNAREIAVLCILLLRGPQTPGELRTRTARIETFDELSEVEATLDGMRIKEYVVRLPRQPGQKEVRYAHLLAGEVVADPELAVPHRTAAPTPAPAPAPARPTVPTPGDSERIATLEETVEALRMDLADLRAQLGPLLG